jgi:hypothetical protein
MPKAKTYGRLGCVLVPGLVLLVAQGLAAQDVKERQDHPLLPRVKGYQIAEYKEKGSDDAKFCVRTAKVRANVKGRYWRFVYRRARGADSPTGDQVRNYYRELFKKARAAPICDSPPDLDARLVKDGVETWVHVRAFAPGESYELSVVEPAQR